MFSQTCFKEQTLTIPLQSIKLNSNFNLNKNKIKINKVIEKNLKIHKKN